MGFSVRTNNSSNNSLRNLNKNNKASKENLEKLASGYSINKSADDASGLAISKKMRAQINALETISPGCEDGMNLIHTADGYLDEIQNILKRMTELSEKSANGILDDPTDRAALQKEMNQLGAEIDRIAETANFNGNKLFCPTEVTVHMVDSVTDKINISELVEGSQYFSDPAPNYIDLGDNTLCPNTEDSDAKLRGDTLKTLADAVKNYMSSNGLAAPNMVKGKLYYTPDGKTVIDGSDPLSMNDDDIKAVIGDPYFSVDTYPSEETQIIHHDAIHRDAVYHPPVHHEAVYHPGIHHPAVHHPEVPGKYSLNASALKSSVIDPNDPAKTLALVQSTTDAFKSAHMSEGIAVFQGKSIYIKKDSYEAYVDVTGSSNYPSSEYNAIPYQVVLPVPAYDEPAWDEEGWTTPAYDDPEWTEPAVDIPAWDEKKTINVKSKQSYVDRIDERERIVKQWDEKMLKPITLQIGETSQKTDKLNLTIYDIHTDKLFTEKKQFIGYADKAVEHPGTEAEIDFSNIGGTMEQPTSGNTDFKPGTEATTTIEPDYTKPLYHYDEAIRDNTDTSPYKNAVTLDISNQEFALCNVEHAREVTDYISLIRASYGAMENRLEHTVDNHENTIENMAAAKSRIYDTDMAAEMMKFTQNNIMSQVSQSMLAQSNTNPQRVLELLK